MNNTVTAMGEVLWDIFPEKKTLGGAVANFAFHMAQLGFDSRIVSAVGNDPLGDEVEEIYRQKKLKTCIQRVPFPTGTVQVSVDGEGIPTYDIRENVAWDNIRFTPELEELARHTRAFCFGTLGQRSPVSGSAVARFLETMLTGEGQYRIFDINLRQHFYTREVIVNSLRHCDILKINDEELDVLREMFGYPEEEDRLSCLRLLKEYALDILILTCGVRGSYVFSAAGEESFLETPRIEVADTVGAGDSFTAGFCSAVLSRKTIREAHEKAVRISAYVCTQTGGMPELPEELRRL